MITTNTLAANIAVSPQTLAHWRLSGKGPKFTKAGRKVLYFECDVDNWLEANRRQSTSQIMERVQ